MMATVQDLRTQIEALNMVMAHCYSDAAYRVYAARLEALDQQLATTELKLEENRRMKQIYKDRWDKLLTFLDMLDPERFHYGHFVDMDIWQGDKALSCGTTACIAGWATAVFPELTLHGSRYQGITIVFTEGYEPPKAATVLGPMPTTDDTLCRWFGLTRNEVSAIFYPGRNLVDPYSIAYLYYWHELDGYRSPLCNVPLSEVVAFIRKVLERREEHERSNA